MKALLFTLLLGGLTTAAFAQSDVLRLKSGSAGEKSIPFADRYRYDQFRDGKILYQTGASANARFNYNIVLGEMQFIDQRGDTLAVASEPVVRMVGVGPDVFWFDRSLGYLEVIEDDNPVKLALKQGLKTVRSEKRGGYGQSSGTSAITNYQFYSSGNTSVRALDAKGDLLLIKDKTYYLIDQNGRAVPVNKASILNVFRKQREAVKTYLESEPIDFKQEADLKKLLKYCSNLL
ncbi:hypothetical protein DYU11_32375 [Fibrisoma montanum]|uniref:Uncharacterized protein n=1 Tax=Fibrisoma montanum TaxID=2305895 RepID=A0A418LVX6_9BACT|nr:hypothetical protein [Fibrisoma montanum]RIV17387.1 hypothetical protein DYU11_32375 [Fibrisoma montanum]